MKPSVKAMLCGERGCLCCGREIDGHSLPVSVVIYACMLELIASRMQSVISTKS